MKIINRKNTQEKLDAYLEKLKVANKKLEIEQEKLEILLLPKSTKEKERNLHVMFDIVSKFQTLHEKTETIRENAFTIHNIPEIRYPETKGHNKIHSLNRDNGIMIKEIETLNKNLINTLKILLEKM